jgi:signal transduction histidine kinase
MWDEILSARVVVWLTEGVAASVSVDESEQFVPFGTITRMVYFRVEQQSLPAPVQIAFYRICQEALHNITKHAQATQVEIQLNMEPTTIQLFIRDDGCGFDPLQTPAGHYGLTMMQERAEAVAAILTVRSQPNEGTLIAIRWTNDMLPERL